MSEEKIVTKIKKKISSPQIIKAGVIGNPVKDSLSPKIHNFFLEKYAISGSYQTIEINDDDFDNAIKNLIEQGFSGFNVTIPFKEKIFSKCDFLSEEAKIIKAVNTVVIDKNKKLHGYNSDAKGFIENIYNKFPDIVLKQKTAFVIGAGGACRAIVYGLISQGVKSIYLTNRNSTRVKKLITDFNQLLQNHNCNIFHLSQNDFENSLDKCDILINSSSLGMTNQPRLIIDIKKLNSSAIVYDIVYKPLETDLLKSAKSQGNPIITGIGMLVQQALVGFNKFYGVIVKDTDNLEKTLILNKI